MAIDFQSLETLEPAALDEVVREAELRVSSQLATANSADARALSWLGFLITITVAIVGGTFAIFPRLGWSSLVIGAVGLALSLAFAAFKAMEAARPTGFCFPGNEPRNWLPEHWQEKSEPFSLRRARIEQAEALDNMIQENKNWAKRAGQNLTSSMDIALWAIPFWSLATGSLMLIGL